jgi:hypothetical protein
LCIHSPGGFIGNGFGTGNCNEYTLFNISEKDTTMEQIADLIVVFNSFLLIGLVAGIIRWIRRHGLLSEKRLVLILLGYFSYSFISPMIPLLFINPGLTLIIDIAFLLVLWSIGYPLFSWGYRHFFKTK